MHELIMHKTCLETDKGSIQGPSSANFELTADNPQIEQLDSPRLASLKSSVGQRPKDPWENGHCNPDQLSSSRSLTTSIKTQHSAVKKLLAMSSTVQEPKRTWFVAKMVLSPKFEMAGSFVTGMYIIFAIFETNWMLKYPKNPMELPFEMHVAENIFEALYALEVLLRLVVHRMFFFLGQDKWWNTFDLCLSLSAIASNLMVSFATQMDPLLFRLVRVVRVSTKVFKFANLSRYLSDLRLMLNAFLHSLLALSWGVFFLAGFILFYALLLCQQMAFSIADPSMNFDPAAKLAIHKNFGSVPLACFTLLKSISGGVDWGDTYAIVRKTGQFNAMAFLSYIILAWLSLSNIISSIFLEKVMHLARPDTRARAIQQLQDNLESAREMCELFQTICDGSETISPEILNVCLRDIRVVALFEAQGLEITDINTFMELLVRIEGAQSIHIESFVTSCLSLRGYARSIDLLAMKHRLRAMEVHFIRALSEHKDTSMAEQSNVSRAQC